MCIGKNQLIKKKKNYMFLFFPEREEYFNNYFFMKKKNNKRYLFVNCLMCLVRLMFIYSLSITTISGTECKETFKSLLYNKLDM